MIRAGFLSPEDRADLIALARDGPAARRLARRANALVLLDDGWSCEEIAKVLFVDKAFDNDWLRKERDDRGALAVIPPKGDHARQISGDFDMSKWRHLIENIFCNSPQAFPPSCACRNLKPAPLKQWRRIATRYDKTDQSFAAMINLTTAVMALK